MIAPGSRVRVKSTARGSDQSYAGRKGIVKKFDPSLPWTSPRALLAPDQFVTVHFEPRSKRERTKGSPIKLLAEESLVVI